MVLIWPSLYHFLIEIWVRIRVQVFNVTFNNISFISWWWVLLVAETILPVENHRSVASHWQTCSHNVVHLDLIGIRTYNIIDCVHWLHKFNYHAIKTASIWLKFGIVLIAVYLFIYLFIYLLLFFIQYQ